MTTDRSTTDEVKITIDTPSTGDDIARELRSVGEQTADYWRSLDPAVFFAPIGDAWSPAENVRHLVTSNRPVALGLAAPKIVFYLRYGRGKGPSRTFDEVVEVYRGALSDGLRAMGPYIPQPIDADATAENRDALVEKNHSQLRAAVDSLRRWNEKQLDRARVPHPALGKMTLREILFFTIYHNAHHARSVAAKLAATG